MATKSTSTGPTCDRCTSVHLISSLLFPGIFFCLASERVFCPLLILRNLLFLSPIMTRYYTLSVDAFCYTPHVTVHCVFSQSLGDSVYLFSLLHTSKDLER